jgi:hypothetical protein
MAGILILFVITLLSPNWFGVHQHEDLMGGANSHAGVFA